MSSPQPVSTRSLAKRDDILTAALDVFAHHGFVGASTDMIAARAAISKQTLYKLFGDKHGVFDALIRQACEAVVDPFADLVGTMSEAGTADVAVAALAEQFVGGILNPRVQRLRRLVIAEALRFPDLGLVYWEQGFGRTLDSLAQCLAVLHDRGLLRIEDPHRAAQHLAGLLLWIPSNRAMFDVEAAAPTRAEIEALITDGVAVFVGGYAPGE